MKAARLIWFWTIFSLVIFAAPNAYPDVATYTLEDVILDDGNVPMSGTFSWNYTPGDFENGVGQFSYLDIPYTAHDHTDLNATFDIGSSIEITLEGSVHDDGVDITLFLLQPLTPTTLSHVDLVRSKYEIGGNGFHDGLFVSGVVASSEVTDVTSQEDLSSRCMILTNYPNPFRGTTAIRFALPVSAEASVQVFDVTGRLVTTLAGGRFPSGLHVRELERARGRRASRVGRCLPRPPCYREWDGDEKNHTTPLTAPSRADSGC